jgi:PAS domain-containing protein
MYRFVTEAANTSHFMQNLPFGPTCSLDAHRSPERLPVHLLSAPSHPEIAPLSGGVVLLDRLGRVLLANEQICRWFGMTDVQIGLRKFAALLGGYHPEWQAQMEELLSRDVRSEHTELAAGEGRHRLSAEVLRRDSEIYLRLNYALPRKLELERLVPEESWVQLLSEEAYQQALNFEGQAQALLTRLPGLLFNQKPDFSIVVASGRFEQLTGIRSSACQNGTDVFWSIIHEEDLDAVRSRVETEASSCSGSTCVFRIRHALTGRISHIWEHRLGLRSKTGRHLGCEGVWLDVTRQAVAEQGLSKLSWNEDLGTLTVGMAHDFANMLCGIAGLSQVYQTKEVDASVREGLGTIHKTAMKAGQLSRRLRELHHGKPGSKAFHDLNEVVSSLQDLLHRALPPKVQLEITPAGRQLPVYLDSFALQKTLVNLALRAAEALPSGGRLTLSTCHHSEAPNMELLLGKMPAAPLVSLTMSHVEAVLKSGAVNDAPDPFTLIDPFDQRAMFTLRDLTSFAQQHGAAISKSHKDDAEPAVTFWFSDASIVPPEQSPKARQRHTLLMWGPDCLLFRNSIEALRTGGFYVVPLNQAERLQQTLRDPAYQFTALVLVCPKATSLPADYLPRRKDKIRTIAIAELCEGDGEPAHISKIADAVLEANPATDLASQIRKTLELA